ncbi:hypothetical protein O9K51_06200 [Purpureocillium lavendulum]|uniref:Uncharacterized protein n=1 Tax=Purpureocillium lavendulum TaxID=1247861 RepID=A0AB34FML0_9HYPO|nr:hypothetical protein O9K51_06200 [Purpureocillium lavendulum]
MEIIRRYLTTLQCNKVFDEKRDACGVTLVWAGFEGDEDWAQRCAHLLGKFMRREGYDGPPQPEAGGRAAPMAFE